MTDHPVPWPGNYDVADVPAIEFEYALSPAPENRSVRAWAVDGPIAYLFDKWGMGVYGADGAGYPVTSHYDDEGRRKQYYWEDGTPASSYLPDGSQIPLFAVEYPDPLTDDSTDPLWVPPEDPEDPPVDPEDPEDPPPPVPWPGNYDVADLPAIEFPYGPTEPPVGRWVRGWAPDGPVAELFDQWGSGVYGQDGYGDANHEHYDLEGRRKQYYWPDGTPASSYLPDGSQIPLYSEGHGDLLTNDSTDPLWVPPEDPEDPEDPPVDPEDPEDPEDPPVDPAPLILEPATLQGFAQDDMIPDDVAALAVDSAIALVDAYTRGRHVDTKGRARPGISTVVLTVAARIAANPGQVSRYDQAGAFSSRRGVGFTGFTLAEQSVLNRYRKRAIGP